MADSTASSSSGIADAIVPPHGRVFAFRGSELLVREDGLSLPGDEVRGRIAEAVQWQSIGDYLGQPCVAAALKRDAAAPAGYVFKRLREMLNVLGEEGAGVASRAFQIAEWARTHRFCGACGTATVRVPEEYCMKCPRCGLSAYPRISPAMMVLVRWGDRILLARNASFVTGRYSALAGFVEAGESLEATVHREVYEEVGLRVRDLKYFRSQSWPFPHSLMLAFTAEYDGGDIRVDGQEIVDARWFGPDDDLPDIPPMDSIAGHLIRANLPQGKRPRGDR
ncbi:NADH pyrophosphatase [Bordetella genomosp. 9]|uniref:NAD(+) diphosphatase n=1 Tax=Bordetella genomosp. 9 TaxID=1416803 RepID=A0A1W6YVF0_9BORD|nr:NAD(+) diphosphatase [Bordetella genomosp. 9]ARP84964.1 NADH pyrophosphatase [Bordetella genomosp. 9]